MAIYTIPGDGARWSQNNNSEYSGVIVGSRSVDLSAGDIVKLSPRFGATGIQSTSGATFEDIHAIVAGDFESSGIEKYYLITSDELYTVDEGYFDSLTLDASAPALDDESDGVVWDDSLWVSTASNLAYKNGGSWTTGLTPSLSNYFGVDTRHPLCVAFNNKLLIGDGSTLYTRTTGGTVATAFTLPDNFIIVWMISTNDRIYIGTRHKEGGRARLFEWDGSSVSFNFDYEIDSQKICSGVMHEGDLYVVSQEFALYRFNGSGFTFVDAHPMWYKKSRSQASTTVSPAIPQRAMVSAYGEIYIAMNTGAHIVDKENAIYGMSERGYSGIYAWNPVSGLYHKYAVSLTETANLPSLLSDYGQLSVLRMGAICAVPPRDFDGSFSTNPPQSLILAGARLDGNGTGYYTIGAPWGAGENRGHIITQRIQSQGIIDIFQKVVLYFSNVTESNDKIFLKYRTRERPHMPRVGVSATWTSTTTFTSIDDFSDVRVGDEITLLDETNAGATAHITNISYSAPTYTVTVDEAIGVASMAHTIQVTDWIKVAGNVSSSDTAGYKEFVLSDKNIGKWIDLKVELRGQEIVLERIKIITDDHIPNKA